MDDVQAAVAECYRVFGGYRFDGGCLDAPGIGPLEKRLLRVTPPAEIPSELLTTYLAALPASISGRVADDVRAVLPRLLALAAEDSTAAEAARDVAERAGFRAWPPSEAEAVARCLAALARGAAEPAAARAG